MNLIHRAAVTVGMVVPAACAPTASAVRGRSQDSAVDAAEWTTTNPAAPMPAAESSAPTSAAGGDMRTPPAAGPTTTVTFTAPHATTTTTLVLPEDQDAEVDDATWWSQQPGATPPEWVKMRESRGDYRAVNPSTGAGGAWQFLPSTWRSVGGSGLAQDASPAEQDYRAALLWDGGRGCAHWDAC